MSFFNKFDGVEKINLFLGDFLIETTNKRTKVEYSNILIDDINENLQGYVKNRNSLFQVTQIYLDGVICSRNRFLDKIKKIYEITRKDSYDEYFNIFSNSKKINSIFSMNYDLILEEILSNRIEKLMPGQVLKNEECPSDKISYYKILGDISNTSNMFVSFQDYRKLTTLAFYKEYFKKIKQEMIDYPTFILGLNLEDVDFLDTLEHILGMSEEKIEIYAFNNSSILKAKTVERLNNMGIKLVDKSNSELHEELKNYFGKVDSFEEVYAEKKIWR